MNEGISVLEYDRKIFYLLQKNSVYINIIRVIMIFSGKIFEVFFSEMIMS